MHKDWAHPLPYLRPGTKLVPVISALVLGSPLPHLHRDWAHPLPHLHPHRACDSAGGAAVVCGTGPGSFLVYDKCSNATRCQIAVTPALRKAVADMCGGVTAAPTSVPSWSSTACRQDQMARINACRKFATKPSCTAAGVGLLCQWCAGTLGASEGCYVVAPDVSCTTAEPDNMSYGAVCPTNLAAALANGAKIVGGVLIAIIVGSVLGVLCCIGLCVFF